MGTLKSFASIAIFTFFLIAPVTPALAVFIQVEGKVDPASESPEEAPSTEVVNLDNKTPEAHQIEISSDEARNILKFVDLYLKGNPWVMPHLEQMAAEPPFKEVYELLKYYTSITHRWDTRSFYQFVVNEYRSKTFWDHLAWGALTLIHAASFLGVFDYCSVSYGCPEGYISSRCYQGCKCDLYNRSMISTHFEHITTGYYTDHDCQQRYFKTEAKFLPLSQALTLFPLVKGTALKCASLASDVCASVRKWCYRRKTPKPPLSSETREKVKCLGIDDLDDYIEAKVKQN